MSAPVAPAAPFAPTWPPPPAVPLSGHLGDRLRGSVVQFALGRGARRAGFPASEITAFAIWQAGAGSAALAARAAAYAAAR